MLSGDCSSIWGDVGVKGLALSAAESASNKERRGPTMTIMRLITAVNRISLLRAYMEGKRSLNGCIHDSASDVSHRWDFSESRDMYGTAIICAGRSRMARIRHPHNQLQAESSSATRSALRFCKAGTIFDIWQMSSMVHEGNNYRFKAQ